MVMIRTVARLLGLHSPATPPIELDPRAALVQLDADRNRVQQAIVAALARRADALLADDDAQVEALDREIDALHRDLERGDLIERRLLAGMPTTHEVTQ